MLKTLKKAGLSLLSLAMTISMLTLTPMVKVSAATASLISKENFIVAVSGSANVNDQGNPSLDAVKEAIFDTSDTTFWQSAVLSGAYSTTKENTWLQIDLGNSYMISEVVYKARNAAAFKATGNITGDVIVMFSENPDDWSNAVEFSADTLWGDAMQSPAAAYTGTTTVNTNNTVARYMRVSGTNGYHWDSNGSLYGTNICIAGLEIYGLNADGSELPKEPTNVAANLPADQIKAVFTADGTNAKVTSLNDRPLTRIVNGNKSSGDYAEFSLDQPESVSSYLQLDLGAVYNLSEIKAWFYADGTRVYKNVVVLISETEEFEEDDYTVVFNGDPNNVHNLGLEAGTEITDAETTAGRTYAVDNVNARYVRFYMYGSTAAHKQNHVAEIEVYGVEAVVEEVEEVDVTALEELVLLAEDEYGTSNALGQYTVASFTAYEAAYTAAVAVISKADNNEALTQVEVDEAKAALETAIAGLVSVEVLKENLVEAKNVGEASEDWAEGYNKFMAPYFAAAEAALAKEDATQAEIDAADEELANAVGEAVEFADAYEEVLAAIVNAETTDTVGKTEESVAALQAAIQAAHAAVESDSTDINVLAAQIDALAAAVSGLEDIPVSLYDKTALQAAIDAADAILAALGEADLYDVYTEDSALAFETAYEEAKLTYEDDGTDYEEDDYDFQAAIDAAAEALAEATAALKENEVLEDVDKEALVNFVEDYEELYNADNEEGIYTAESFAAFKAAYEAALAIIDNDNATQAEVDAALIVAADALDELVEAVNKTALKAALDYALTLNEAEYTPSTWANAVAAYGQANAVYENAEATQEEVDAAIVLLQEAQAQLVKRADKTALVAAITAADAVEKDLYTAESVEALEAAYEAATAVNTDAEATQEAVDEAAAALEAAIDALAEKPVDPAVDKAALKAALDAADALNVTTDKYTEESVEAFDVAYSEAAVIYADEEVSQEAVDEAAAALLAAIDGLKEIEIVEVDKEALLAVVEEAEEIIENADAYTVESYVDFKAAYDAAVVVLDNVDATQEEVDNATTALEAAIEALEEKPAEPTVDKTALEAAIAAADALDVNTDNYTIDSVEAFDVAYSEAIVIFADEEATQEAVDEATALLEAAIEGLTPYEDAEIDKDALLAALEEAEEIIANADAYTPESFADFKAAYDAAVVVADNDDATQEEIDNATATLLAGIEALVEAPKVDKTALEAAIAAADALNVNDEEYTVESVEAFDLAYSEAVLVFADEEATQEAVDEAAAALLAAIDGLDKVEIEEVDKEALLNALDDAEEIIANADAYTEESYAAFKAAYDAGVVVADNEEATQAEVDAAVEALVAAVAALEEKPVEVLENLALNKTGLIAKYKDGTDAEVNPDRPLSHAVDGNKSSCDDNHAGIGKDNDQAGTTSVYFQVDLEDVYELSSINLYRYWKDGRSYSNSVVVVSETEDFANATVIYNADVNNIHGFGAGTDASYVETSEGKTFNFDAVNGRYVRVYMSGSTVGNTVHIVEIEVFGKEVETPEVPTVNKDALIAAIDNATAAYENEAGYTPETYTVFKAMYEYAVMVRDNEAATQAEVDLATATLIEKFEALVEVETPKADKSALEALIAEVEALNEGDYSINSWSKLQTALTAGKDVVANAAATQEEVDAATAALQAKKDALVDISGLKAAIAAANEKLAEADKYTDESVSALRGQLGNAEFVVGSSVGFVPADVEMHTNNLLNAIAGLVEKQPEPSVDKSALEALIAEVEALNEADYSKKSWSNLQAALTAGKDVVADASATQEVVDAAKAELETRKGKLVSVVALRAALAAADEKLAEADKYTEDSVTALRGLYDNANMVLNSNFAYVQEDADMHAQNVINAINALIEKQPEPTVNKDALAEVIARAEAKLAEADKYTDETVAVLEAQLANAKDVMDNADATQMDVDQAVVRLNAAINALEEKPVEVLDTKPLEDKIAEAKEFKEDEYYAPTFEALEAAIKAAEEALATVTTNAQVAEEVEKLQAVIDALIARPARVVNLTAKATDYKTIQLNWDAVEGATYYQIYRLNTQTGKWIKFKTSTTNSYKVTGVKTGVKYSYRVIANKELADGAIVAGKSSSTKSATALLQGEPVLTMKANGKTKFDLSWTKVAGATRYLVYRKSETEGWKKILTLGGDVTTYTTSSMVPNTYTYMIKAARYDSKDRTQTNGSNTCTGTSVFSKPVITVTKASSTTAKISWKAVEGVKYYEVYRATSKSGTYSKIKTTTALSFTNKSLKAGKSYFYKVRAYRTYNNGKVYTSYSKVVEYKA